MNPYHLQKHYLLLAAFDLTGRFLFGDKWTGTEAWARRVDDPKKKIAEKAALKAEIKALTREQEQVSQQHEFADTEAEHAAIDAKWKRIHNELTPLKEKLRFFPQNFDAWSTDFSAYSRACEVESLLRDGLDSSQFQILYGPGYAASWSDLKQQRHFLVDWRLSMIRLPVDRSGSKGRIKDSQDSQISPENPAREPRRYAAFVSKGQVESWLEATGKGDLSFAATDQNERNAIHSRALISRAENEPQTKKEVFQMMLRFDPLLKERAFNRLWKQFAPPELKRGGRRKRI